MKRGFSINEAKYFCQTIDEKPALKVIFKILLNSNYTLALDVGCGIGVLESSLPKNSAISLVGIDLNKKYLGFAKLLSSIQSVDFLLADARFLPFRDQAFDVIVIHDVLFGLDLIEILNGVVKNLKQNGAIFCDLPNFVFYRAFPFLLPFSGFITYDLKEVEKKLKDSGIIVIRRYAVSLSKNTRLKFRLPKSLNSVMENTLKRLPANFHSFLSKIWFLVILFCRKST